MDEVVSVIITVYNGEDFVANAIESVINQSYKNLNIVIVDDGSIDNSLYICRQYQALDKRISVYHQDNSGVSSARNLGLKMSIGQYVCFLDADDIYKETFVEKMLYSIKQNDSELCICGYSEMGTTMSPYFLNDSIKYIEDILNEALDRKCLNPVWNKMFKKDLLNVYFDENISMGEDLKLVCDYLKPVSQISVLKDLLYIYNHNRTESLTGNYKINSSQIIMEYTWLYDLYKCKGLNVEKINRWLVIRLYDLMDSNNLSEFHITWKNYKNMNIFNDCSRACISKSFVVKSLLMILRKSWLMSYLCIKIINHLYRRNI